jgi:hypothetical protein
MLFHLVSYFLFSSLGETILQKEILLDFSEEKIFEQLLKKYSHRGKREVAKFSPMLFYCNYKAKNSIILAIVCNP